MAPFLILDIPFKLCDVEFSSVPINSRIPTIKVYGMSKRRCKKIIKYAKSLARRIG